MQGVQLSWESTCLASRGSAVRSRLPPPFCGLFAKLACGGRIRQAGYARRDMEFDARSNFVSETGTQLSWLEHSPDKREVGGSSPLVPTKANFVRSLRGKSELSHKQFCRWFELVPTKANFAKSLQKLQPMLKNGKLTTAQSKRRYRLRKEVSRKT